MRKISIGLIAAVVMILIPAWARAGAEVPGWDNTFTLGAQNISVSDDLKLIAVGQDNAVFLFNDTGKQFFTLKVDKAATPSVSPEGGYIMIQTAGTDESVRNVYIYTRESKLLWSMRDLPAVSRFSGSGEYILFSSWRKGGAILTDVRGKIIWNKGPWEIKPDWKRMLISQNGETILFNNQGLFNREGKLTKQMDLGPNCDLASDGSLIVNQKMDQGKIVLSMFDPTGTRKWGLAVTADPAAGDEAVLGVSINQRIDRVAMVGNGQGRGYLYLFDLAGKQVWAKADLPKILPGDLNAVKVAQKYVRVNTMEGPRVYDLQGELTWKAPGPEADYFMSDDGQRVMVAGGNAISYKGPGYVLFPGPEAETISEEAPAPITTEAGSPQGVTAPPAGVPGAVTQTALPSVKPMPVVVPTQAITQPVLPGESTKSCGCLVKNIITAVLAIIFTVLVLFLYQRFFGKKRW
ncbi:MAG: hypothetical protein NT056_03640 [Proteobacteria bacterium]|nr:hypothetical protein [Pseudomonadota bacterium]